MTNKDSVLTNIQAYKHKYYKGLLLHGVLFTLLSIISLILIVGLLEYSFWFGSTIRGSLLLVFLVISFIVIYKSVVIPLFYLLGKNVGISDEIAANRIGNYYSNISDTLLNYIQLNKVEGNNSLVQASITQRSSKVDHYSFDKVIHFKDYLKTAPYLFTLFIVIMVLGFWKPSLLVDSTQRIANFNKQFSQPALFHFTVSNKKLIGYKNENFTLFVSTVGSATPEDVYLVTSQRKIKLNRAEAGFFNYEFNNLQTAYSFYLESSGIRSRQYTLELLTRPSLKSFITTIEYPSYTNLTKSTFQGVGNLIVPEGSSIHWDIESINTDDVNLSFNKDSLIIFAQNIDDQLFKIGHVATQSDIYEMKFKHDSAQNKEPIIYSLDVISDKHPKIQVDNYQDTTLYSFIILKGKVSDDYGLNNLILKYKSSNESSFHSTSLTLSASKDQNYYYKWPIRDLLSQESNELNYYLEVWDNDAINGPKSTRTTSMTFTLPIESEINDLISKSEEKSKENVSSALEQASELENNIKEAKERLKGKKELSWQDENKLKEIIEKKKAINEAIEQLREQNNKSNLQKERFGEQKQRIQEKAEQLQKLMDDLLDEETKQLYEELQKLLEDNKDINDVQDKLSKLDNKEKNLEKELERALELFKRIQLEQKIENAISGLEDLANKQDSLASQTNDKSNSLVKINKQQEEIIKETKEIEEDMSELNDINQDLKNPESIPDHSQDLEDINKNNEDISNELEKGKRKKGSELQEKSAEQMQQLADKMKTMQEGMQLEMMQENLDHLRDVVHSLIKLSFDQESLMDDFRTIDQSDPRFVELSQTQIKLKDDAKILEDSLLSLANRVFQISSFVTREVADMNQYMDESSVSIKERHKAQAVSKQQFAMTSMNNLALLLDDVLQQMQQQMADAMGRPEPGDKDGKDQPGMSELQKQLNDKIKSLKKGNKSGRQLSEELAKLAAEQEQLRKMLQEHQDNMDNKGGDGLADIIKKMEETEIDLVNKNITSETIKRQEQIFTRLLQSDEALREQEKDEKREGQQAKSYDDFLPTSFEEYIKAKELEIELLKTIPARLYPHYKNEVNEYFDRVNNKDKTNQGSVNN